MSTQKSNSKLVICNTNIHPGETANLAMPLPERYSCSPLFMPIRVIHGKKKGPTVVIYSGLKGTELNGLQIVNRLIESTPVEEVSGTIIAIPVMNIFGLTYYPSTIPMAEDLTDCFPGNEEGSFRERIASIVTEEILKKADICIELQTGGINHNILPQVYCNFEDKKAQKHATLFQTPVITNFPEEENNLRDTIKELHTELFVYQAGEAVRFDENAIDLGVKGIKNLMKALDMLKEQPSYHNKPSYSRDEDWISTHRGGILTSQVTLGQTIKAGDRIGTISDPFGTGVAEYITTEQEGIVVGMNTSPLVHEGLPVYKIASFIDYDKAETKIEEWDKKQPDSYINQ
ncbi:succinylglutamate desuccinylase/aspartoacylase family protein [bacterium]|nr:succinylglutamate desuccinylase/aspartoacylase family protein [bacterium]